MEWVSASTGYGEVGRDEGVADQPLIINGIEYDKVIGTHAHSEIKFHLGGNCDRFTTEIGLDERPTDPGSVVFKIHADGEDENEDGDECGTDWINEYGTYLETDSHYHRGLVIHPPGSDLSDLSFDPAVIERASPAPESLQTHLRELLEDPSVNTTVYQPGDHEYPLGVAFDGQPYLLVVLSVPVETEKTMAQARLEDATDTLRMAVDEERSGQVEPTTFSQRQRLIAPLIDEITQSALDKL